MKSKKQGTLKRVIKMLFEFYPVLMPLVVVCVLLNAVVSSTSALRDKNRGIPGTCWVVNLPESVSPKPQEETLSQKVI